MTARTCAFCGIRDAVGETKLDGKRYQACAMDIVSADDEDRIELWRPVILEAVEKWPGLGPNQLASVVKVAADRRVAFRRALGAAVVQGKIRQVGVRTSARFFPGDKK